MREDDFDQAERLMTLRNDQRVREQAQGATMHGFAQSEANADLGRYGAIGKPTVVGSAPISKVPQLPESSPWSGAQPQPGPEPPLDYLEPSALSLLHAEQLPDPAPAAAASVHAPLLPDVAQRDAESGPFSDGERDA